MSTNIISLYPTIENKVKYLGSGSSYEADPATDDPEEAQYYATRQEENFGNWEHQVQNSINLAISLLKGEQELNLASKCADYIENRYNEAYQEKINIDGIPLAKAELRNN